MLSGPGPNMSLHCLSMMPSRWTFFLVVATFTTLSIPELRCWLSKSAQHLGSLCHCLVCIYSNASAMDFMCFISENFWLKVWNDHTSIQISSAVWDKQKQKLFRCRHCTLCPLVAELLVGPPPWPRSQPLPLSALLTRNQYLLSTD